MMFLPNAFCPFILLPSLSDFIPLPKHSWLNSIVHLLFFYSSSWILFEKVIKLYCLARPGLDWSMWDALGVTLESGRLPKFCSLGAPLLHLVPTLLSGLTLNSWPQIPMCSQHCFLILPYFPSESTSPTSGWLFHVAHIQHFPPRCFSLSDFLTEEKQQ